MYFFDEDGIKIEIVVYKLLMELVSMCLSFHFDANSYCFSCALGVLNNFYSMNKSLCLRIKAC